MKNSDNKKLLCSFCGANESDVRFLVEGESAYICEECIDKASQIVNDTKKPSTFKFEFKLRIKNLKIFRKNLIVM